MPELRDFLNSLPADTQELLKMVWESIPPSERGTLQEMFKGFPTEANMMRLLVNLAAVQLKMTFGGKHRVAIVGPANVGKSTLYNHLIQSKSDRAEVSPIPGTTRQNKAADAGLFTVIDTPGADAIGPVGEREKEAALNAAASADFIVIVFDAIQGIKKHELDLYQELKALGKPYIVVMNKIDLVRRDVTKVVQKASENLSLRPEQIIPVSAKEDKNVEKVLMAIAVTEPGMITALGQAMPAYRWQLAWRAIVSAASMSAVIALTPLPFVDFAPLVVTQSVMVLGIARIYNYKLTLERARELVATFGLGLLGRTLFQELSKFGGIPGWVLSAAIAASTTVVMGYAASKWFESGERLSNETMRAITKNMTQMLLSSLKNIGKRKPKKETLQQEIADALSKSSMGQDRSVLERGPQAEPRSIQRG